MSVSGADQSVGQLRRVNDAANTAQKTLGKLSGGAGQMAKGVGQVAGGLVRVGEVAAVALLGAAAASEKVTVGFQANMELIHTQAGATQREVVEQSKAVQKIVHQVGTAPIELAKGLYHIESVGVRGKAALDILTAGALGAKTGLASVEETTNALTAVFYSGIGGVTSMTQAMGALDAIVGTGNMRLQDLVDSFSTGILGTAKTFGVGLRELGSALAVLTDAGVPARVAATRLSMTFTHMAAPVPGAIKVLKGLGLAQFDLANDMRKPNGLFVAFKDLHDHLEKVGEIKDGVLTPKGTADVTKIFGGSRFGATAMQLLGVFDRIDLKYKAITAGQDAFGERVAKTMDTTRFKWGQFIGDLQESALAFGEGIDPALARGLGRLDELLVSHLGDIRKMGLDVGHAIDSIDWTKVEHGAESFVGFLKSAWEVVRKIPPEIDAIVLGFLAVNKVSGGLLGTGVGNIVGGLGKAVSNVLLTGLSKIPVVGGALGSATALRVFVVNMPSGGIPGAPRLPSAAPATLFGVSLASLATFAGLALIVPAVALLTMKLVEGRPKTEHEQDVADAYSGGRPIAPHGAGPHRQGTTATISGIWRDHMPVAETNGIWRDHDLAEIRLTNALGANTAALEKRDWLKELRSAWQRAGATMHEKVRSAMADLASGKNIGGAASFLGAKLGNAGFGAGGYETANAAITLLKTLPTSREVTAAIASIESRLPRLATDKADLEQAVKIAQSADPKNVKLDKLNAIMADLKAHGDHTTQVKVQGVIDAVKHKKTSVTTIINVSDAVRLNINNVDQYGKIHTAPPELAIAQRSWKEQRHFLAAGGRYRAGQPRVVGEDGPELDIPDHSGTIVDHDRLQALAGLRVDVHPQAVRLVINGRELVSAMVPYASDPSRRVA